MYQYIRKCFPVCAEIFFLIAIEQCHGKDCNHICDCDDKYKYLFSQRIVSHVSSRLRPFLLLRHDSIFCENSQIPFRDIGLLQPLFIEMSLLHHSFLNPYPDRFALILLLDASAICGHEHRDISLMFVNKYIKINPLFPLVALGSLL